MADHPPPWRWAPMPEGSDDLYLEDADGNDLLHIDELAVTAVPVSPMVAALIQAAPEMDALLREVVDEWDSVVNQDDTNVHLVVQRVKAFLKARIDAARKA